MANYRNNYYKKNSDRQIKSFWIGVITISIVFVLVIIFGFWNPFKIRSYKGIKEIAVPEIFTINKDASYYVLFYKSYRKDSTNCEACIAAEPYVADYAELARKNKTVKPIYVVNVRLPENGRFIAPSGGTAKLDGVSNYQEIQVLYTPTLVLVSGNQITTVWDTKTDVLNELQNESKKVTTVSLNQQYNDEVILFKGKKHAFN